MDTDKAPCCAEVLRLPGYFRFGWPRTCLVSCQRYSNDRLSFRWIAEVAPLALPHFIKPLKAAYMCCCITVKQCFQDPHKHNSSKNSPPVWRPPPAWRLGRSLPSQTALLDDCTTSTAFHFLNRESFRSVFTQKLLRENQVVCSYGAELWSHFPFCCCCCFFL